jgi:lipopolysaccharide biosynthesis regulator YciM
MTDELVKRHIEQLRLTGGDLADLCQPLADAIDALTAERDAAKAKVEQLGCELNVAKYGQPNFAWSVHVAAMAELQAERERLALAICGGEDAPGYANAQTVETLEHVAKQNRQSHWATINSLLAAEAERDRLREALTNILRSHAVSNVRTRPQNLMAETARAALKGKSHE